MIKKMALNCSWLTGKESPSCGRYPLAFLLGVFWLLLFLVGPVRAEVFFGFTRLEALSVRAGQEVLLPVFLRSTEDTVDISIWREVSGRVSYCHVSTEFVREVLVARCSWEEGESLIHFAGNFPHYVNAVLAWTEDQDQPYELHLCLTGSQEECASLRVEVVAGEQAEAPSEAGVSSEESSEQQEGASQAGGTEEQEEGASSENCQWNGDPNSIPDCEGNGTVSEESSGENSGGQAQQDQGSQDSGMSFLDRLRQNAGSSGSSSGSVWDGSEDQYDSADNSSSQSCDPTNLPPVQGSYTLKAGESTVVELSVRDGCGQVICSLRLGEGDETELEPESWLRVVKREDSGCASLELHLTAPENPGEYQARFPLRVEFSSGDETIDQTIEAQVSLNVVPAYQVGGVIYLTPEQFSYVNIMAKSTLQVAFYGCSGPGGFRNRIYFSVEESSYYHQGAIEPVMKFVGDHQPQMSDFPTWDDYYTIASYLYRDISVPRENWQLKSTELNPCPRDYLYDWTSWYGKIDPAYEDYYYCLGLPLTRILEVYTPEDAPKCGWWAVTLFNNTNERRDGVRLWVEVASGSGS